MRTRNNQNAKEELKLYENYVSDKETLKDILKSNKEKKIFLEIGMGKGTFITNKAYADKDNIYIGVELSETVLALAIKKLKRFEEEKNEKLSNIYLMSFDAKELLSYFEENTVDTLYLNFSDPWPKKKHTKRRLTYKDFLDGYKKVLKNSESSVEFKTDNRLLFEYSMVSLNNYPVVFEKVFLDLHKTEEENIMTEYEEKFSKFGPIYKVVFKFKNV